MPRGKGRPPNERFWSKVDKRGPYTGLVAGRCWMRVCGLSVGKYSSIWVDGKSIPAHTWVWEQEHGPVPEGMELDHLCHKTLCVRASHLQLVPLGFNGLQGAECSRTNRLAQTHCRRGGHPLFGDNLYISSAGKRQCRTCHREGELRRYHARKVAA